MTMADLNTLAEASGKGDHSVSVGNGDWRAAKVMACVRDP